MTDTDVQHMNEVKCPMEESCNKHTPQKVAVDGYCSFDKIVLVVSYNLTVGNEMRIGGMKHYSAL